jgi:hypothetical protein
MQLRFNLCWHPWGTGLGIGWGESARLPMREVEWIIDLMGEAVRGMKTG